jgi:hypothetical protein
MIMKRLILVVLAFLFSGLTGFAASLGTATRSVIPTEVQQVINVDYRRMKSSDTAMDMKAKLLPPNMKQFEDALKGIGVIPDRDMDQITLASFRTKDHGLQIIAVSDQSEYDTLEKKLLGSRYTMDFDHGVDFNLNVVTSDTTTASALSSILKTGMLFKKMSATPTEKTAIDDTSVNSEATRLVVHFKADDKSFQQLIESPMFASVVR